VRASLRPPEVNASVSTRRFIFPSTVASSCLMWSLRVDGKRWAKSDGVDGIALETRTSNDSSGTLYSKASSDRSSSEYPDDADDVAL